MGSELLIFCAIAIAVFLFTSFARPQAMDPAPEEWLDFARALVDQRLKDPECDELGVSVFRARSDLYQYWRDEELPRVFQAAIDAETPAARLVALRKSTLEELEQTLYYTLCAAPNSINWVEGWDQDSANKLARRIHPELSEEEALASATEGYIFASQNVHCLRVLASEALDDANEHDWFRPYANLYQVLLANLIPTGLIGKPDGLASAKDKLWQASLNSLKERILTGGNLSEEDGREMARITGDLGLVR